MRTCLRRALVASSVLAATLASSGAFAAPPPCDNLAQAGESDAVPTVYIESGDTQTPMIARLGVALMKSTTPLRIVFRERPTCKLAADLFNGASMNVVTDKDAHDNDVLRPVRYIPKDYAYTAGSKPPECSVPTDAGSAHPIDLGIGATYLSSCSSLPAQPTTISVVNGPVQAYGFVTNPLSNQVAVTAEEGYLAFGFAQDGGGAAPWTLQELRFTRGPTASTMLTMSSAIRLKPSQMQYNGTIADNSQAIIDAVKAATANPDASIGALGVDLYDVNRDTLKLLAFKTFGQRYAYYPDSTSTSRDKHNVRDGHYAPWAPTPYIANADQSGFTNAAARRVFELVMGTRAGDDVNGLDAVLRSSLVPECAMKVTRAGDGADLQVYSPAEPCGCFYENAATIQDAATTCTACTDAMPCASGVCRFGFCEAK